jgi:hypothetical protein
VTFRGGTPGRGETGDTTPRQRSTLRAIRRFAIAFFVSYALAVVYPAVVPFRGPRPFIFGMPFAMVWAAAWIVAAFFVLLALDRAYSSAERAHDAAVRDRPAGAQPEPE